MRKTAVEFLVEQLEKHYIFQDIKNTTVFLQAKEMEKQQLEKVFKDAFIYGLDWNQKEISFDEYYNEQFKKK